MAIVLDGTTGLAGAATGALNGTLGATTPNTVAATTVVASSTIKGATTIAVGNATPSASGAGITFPATQSASTDANTLDDYKESTWTPTQGAGLTVVGTFSSSGRYTKIGDLVYVEGKLNATTSLAFSAGAVVFGGLPFAASSTFEPTLVSTNQAGNATAVLALAASSGYAQGSMAATTNLYFSCVYKLA